MDKQPSTASHLSELSYYMSILHLPPELFWLIASLIPTSSAGAFLLAFIRMSLAQRDAARDAIILSNDRHHGLALASKYGFTELVRQLITLGVNAAVPDDNGLTPLLWALRQGHPETATTLLQQSPSCRASVNHHHEHGADGGDITSYALYMASQQGFTNVVQQLLSCGHPTSTVNSSSLCTAAEHGHTAVVSVLLQHDQTFINMYDDDGMTALLLAARSGHVAVLNLLLADPDIDQEVRMVTTCYTPLHLAAANGCDAAVSLLCDHLFNVNDNSLQGPHGHTPIFLAVQLGHLQVVEELLARGAMISIMHSDDMFNFEGTVLDWALEHDEDNASMGGIYDLLKSRGALFSG